MATVQELEAAATAAKAAPKATESHHIAPQKQAATVRKMLATNTAPHGASGPLGEREYSFARACAFKLGMIDESMAKEEVHYSGELRKMHNQYRGMSPHAITFRSDQFAVPLSPSRFGSSIANENPLTERLTRELTQKMAMNVSNINPNLVRKTMVTTSETTGGSLIAPPAFGDLIELQVYGSILQRAGCRNIPLPPQGSLVYPRIAGTATSYWQGEPGADTASDVATGALNLTAKTLATLVNVSIQLATFGTVNVEAEIRSAMALASSQKKDVTCLYSGVGGTSPVGLKLYPRQTAWVQGTNKVITYTPQGPSDGATNGYYLQPQDVPRMARSLPDMLDTGYTWVMTTQLLATMESTRADAITAADHQGPFVFPITRSPGDYLNPQLSGGKVIASRLVPSATLGTGTVYPVICGKFDDYIMAQAGVGLLDTNTQGDAYWTTNLQGLRLIEFLDAAPRQESSFVFADSVLASW
jgi:HK97 family phage major capsid protein